MWYIYNMLLTKFSGNCMTKLELHCSDFLFYNRRSVIPEIIRLIVSGSYKTTNNKRIEKGYCLKYIWDNLCDIINNYIAAYKVLLNKKYHSSYKCCYLTTQNCHFFFQEIFHKNSQTIHFYCSSEYQKYFVKYSHSGPIRQERNCIESKTLWSLTVFRRNLMFIIIEYYLFPSKQLKNPSLKSYKWKYEILFPRRSFGTRYWI